MKKNKKLLIFSLGVFTIVGLTAAPGARFSPTVYPIGGSKKSVNSKKASVIIDKWMERDDLRLLAVDRFGKTVLHDAALADFEDEEDLQAFEILFDRIYRIFLLGKQERASHGIRLDKGENSPFLEFVWQQDKRENKMAIDILEDRIANKDTQCKNLQEVVRIFEIGAFSFIIRNYQHSVRGATRSPIEDLEIPRSPVNFRKASIIIENLMRRDDLRLLEIDRFGKTVLHYAVSADFEDAEDVQAFVELFKRICEYFFSGKLQRAKNGIRLLAGENFPFFEFVHKKAASNGKSAFDILGDRIANNDPQTQRLQQVRENFILLFSGVIKEIRIVE